MSPSSRIHERIYAWLDAVDFQGRAIASGDFNLWRGARMYLDEFWGRRPSPPSREEFDRIRGERGKK